MTELIVKVKCSRCIGTGIDNNDKDNPSVPCLSCNATGYVQDSSINITVVMDELNWLKNKIKKILKKLDLPEE